MKAKIGYITQIANHHSRQKVILGGFKNIDMLWNHIWEDHY